MILFTRLRFPIPLIHLIVLSIFLITNNNCISQGYKTSIKIIVSRSDNGMRIPGAKVELFGQTFMGYFTTNENGEIYLTKPAALPTSREALLYCYATGYYPASRYNFGFGSSGKAHVSDFKFTKFDPNEIISIILEPRTRNDHPPAKPVIIGVSDYNRLMDGKKLFKWESVPGAYEYVIQWSRNENFSSPTSVKQIPHVTNAEYQSHVIKFGYGRYYWRVRAWDGYSSGAWSDINSFGVQ